MGKKEKNEINNLRCEKKNIRRGREKIMKMKENFF